MAETSHQQSFTENNGDQEPDQGLDQVHNGVPYQVQDQTLDPSEYQIHDNTVDQAQYELQNQVELQEYQLQDQSQEQPQDQTEDQSQEQLQDQLQYQPQDEQNYQLHDQNEGQDQEEYQVEDQAQDQTIDHVQDQVQDEGVEFENTESEQKQESVDGEANGDEEKRWPGWPGETVFRMLVPAQKVGSIIGRKGDVIKKIVEETRARIKILDGPPGTLERAVMISAKEEPDLSLSPAMEGLLRVYMRIVDGMEGDSAHIPPAKVSTRLLVPAPQAGSLIGKQGATVKSIQEASSCIVRVLGTEDLPVFALQDDRVVEVVGEPTSVHKALELIASHLRKFLVDRGIIPLFETQMQKPNCQMDHMPPHQPWGPPQGQPPNAGGGPGYGHNPPPYMPPPPRHVENYYPHEMHPPQMEKQPHQGISAYGREPGMGGHVSSAPSMVTQQVTQQLQIPLSYADAVIGTSGSNISYIRRNSGATVTIQESRGAPGEMTVEISGSASQVQTAQQLVQNFMAEAGAPPPTQTAVSADQAYNMYATHSSVYAQSATNQGHAAHPGAHGTDYGAGYGF